ncbi:uncharacterized protein A1O9_07024 [Exophiala aquamarina CBS 119918]|uniref:Uncharacterized protein n=1 Tax=Exophiala aquamarina CBS 119918 TaxID=1182545 RepID=A0A072P9Q9_9EURO|nr:uncharacterized protein A1O9_07024 [Exophiala aquamarina CBS 119918]KEF56834.1 hypothetical protein A1O9_07024 [Exophiala aquamarina CBS 119918]
MPERSVSQLDGSKQGLKVVTFEKTPVMSTYLLAWAVGDFEYVEAMTKREHKGRRVSVRVYTTRGMARYTHFALQDACDALDFFAETFGVDYPLPKCDHVVVHEFISGAMENWGMITYKPTKILFDPTTSDNRLMSKASYVIAHELAHQWFGNLVTMSGWNELWLNEGFATWAGYLAVDHMHPEWSIWGQFVDEAMEEAFAVDSLRCSHAIESPVNDEINAQQMFDSISYFKGSAVIRMLVNHLGRDVFLAGISSYLKCRSYGNATSDHLWQALSAVSDIDVKELMKGWIYQAGYPIVKISTASNQLQLRQRPFPRNLQGIDKSIWEVPLGMATSSPEDSRSTINSESCMLKRRTPLPKLNRDHTGFYRCEYPRDHLLSLTGSFANLSALDKVGIISDTRALVLAGQRPASELLDLLLSFKHETDCFIWSQIQKSVSILHSAVTDDKLICKALKSYISQLINPTRRFTNLTGDTDSYIKGELRKTLVQLAVKSGDQNVLDEVHLRFCRWKEGDTKAIDRNHLSSILNVAVSQGDELEYKAVKAEYLKNRTIDGREICIAAMGKTGVPAMARDFLDMTFSSDAHVELQNIHFVGNALSNGPCGMELWKYVRSNWDNVYKRLSANNTALEWFIENSLCGIDDAEVGRDVVQFLEGKKIPELDRPMQIVRDSIEQNVARKGQLRLEVTQWLSENMLPYSEDEGGESLTHRL